MSMLKVLTVLVLLSVAGAIKRDSSELSASSCAATKQAMQPGNPDIDQLKVRWALLYTRFVATARAMKGYKTVSPDGAAKQMVESCEGDDKALVALCNFEPPVKGEAVELSSAVRKLIDRELCDDVPAVLPLEFLKNNWGLSAVEPKRFTAETRNNFKFVAGDCSDPSFPGDGETPGLALDNVTSQVQNYIKEHEVNVTKINVFVGPNAVHGVPQVKFSVWLQDQMQPQGFPCDGCFFPLHYPTEPESYLDRIAALKLNAVNVENCICHVCFPAFFYLHNVKHVGYKRCENNQDHHLTPDAQAFAESCDLR